jgi:hypothetical protein
MRLLNVHTLQLESFDKRDTIPPYAILSHVWGPDEVVFQDLQRPDHAVEELQRRLEDLERRFQAVLDRYEATDKAVSQEATKASTWLSGEPEPGLPPWHAKKGSEKVFGCCKETIKLGFSYAWIDTCCIDKSSSSELSESINSMFAWYKEAQICIAFLNDMESDDSDTLRAQFQSSNWFNRGWTLQELIAPSEVLFYDKNWTSVGKRSTMTDLIFKRTRISADILMAGGFEVVSKKMVAERMSWACERQTTRGEDRAYSLLGLFGVNMPTIYGEGEEAAFHRLQVEIFRASFDYSIFAWSQNPKSRVLSFSSLFAPTLGEVSFESDIEAHPYQEMGIRWVMQMPTEQRPPVDGTGMTVNLAVGSAGDKLIKQHNRQRTFLFAVLPWRCRKSNSFICILVECMNSAIGIDHIRANAAHILRVSKAELALQQFSIQGFRVSSRLLDNQSPPRGIQVPSFVIMTKSLDNSKYGLHEFYPSGWKCEYNVSGDLRIGQVTGSADEACAIVFRSEDTNDEFALIMKPNFAHTGSLTWRFLGAILDISGDAIGAGRHFATKDDTGRFLTNEFQQQLSEVGEIARQKSVSKTLTSGTRVMFGVVGVPPKAAHETKLYLTVS